MTHHNEQRELPLIQQAIIPIAAFAATGDQSKLTHALEQGLDAGMSVSTAKEVLVQLYAYAGFPRSINALATLMALLPKRAERGIQDLEGPAPSHPAPLGDDLLARGSANQTRLVGQPVSGPLFEFAPAIDTFLKVHRGFPGKAALIFRKKYSESLNPYAMRFITLILLFTPSSTLVCIG
jgi:hypothetical protein